MTLRFDMVFDGVDESPAVERWNLVYPLLAPMISSSTLFTLNGADRERPAGELARWMKKHSFFGVYSDSIHVISGAVLGIKVTFLQGDIDTSLAPNVFDVLCNLVVQVASKMPCPLLLGRIADADFDQAQNERPPAQPRGSGYDLTRNPGHWLFHPGFKSALGQTMWFGQQGLSRLQLSPLELRSILPTLVEVAQEPVIWQATVKNEPLGASDAELMFELRKQLFSKLPKGSPVFVDLP